MKNIEAITVCINYADFLEAAIPYNITHLSRWLIVTSPKDEETRNVCHKYNLECLLTEDGDEEFCKGRLIDRGLHHLSSNGWRMHLDADIVLPRYFSQLIEIAELQEDHIYGCDRILVKSWEQWQKLVSSKFLDSIAYSYHHNVIFPEGFQVGSRWCGLQTGYVPIGFFQLWHSSTDEWQGIKIKTYPKRHNSACRTDVQHPLQWDRRKRALIPEIVVVHLESEQSNIGTNWRGRKSKRFGPEYKQPHLFNYD